MQEEGSLWVLFSCWVSALTKLQISELYFNKTNLFTEEDIYNEYANIVLKYFLAEGAVCGHALFFGSLESNSDSFVSFQLTIKS